jgi:hypothetical protein
MRTNSPAPKYPVFDTVPPGLVILTAVWKVTSAPSASIAVSTPSPSVSSCTRSITSSRVKSTISSAPPTVCESEVQISALLVWITASFGTGRGTGLSMKPTRPISFITKAFIASPGSAPAGPPNASPA